MQNKKYIDNIICDGLKGQLINEQMEEVLTKKHIYNLILLTSYCEKKECKVIKSGTPLHLLVSLPMRNPLIMPKTCSTKQKFWMPN